MHAQVEEEIFTRPCGISHLDRKAPKLTRLYREHQTVKDLLNGMNHMDPMSEEFDRKLADLKQNIEHHVEEEEGELFPLVTSRMSCEQLTEIGQRMHDRKASLKTEMAA